MEPPLKRHRKDILPVEECEVKSIRDDANIASSSFDESDSINIGPNLAKFTAEIVHSETDIQLDDAKKSLFLHVKPYERSYRANLLSALASLMIQYPTEILRYFRIIAIELSARALDQFLKKYENEIQNKSPALWIRAVPLMRMFGLLLPTLPQSADFVFTLVQILNQTPFPSKGLWNDGDAIELLLAFYRLTNRFTKRFLPSIDNWSFVESFIEHTNPLLRSTALHLYRDVRGLSETELQCLLTRRPLSDDADDDTIKYYYAFPIVQEEWAFLERQKMLEYSHQSTISGPELFIKDSDLSPLVTTVCGVLLTRGPYQKESKRIKTTMVITEIIAGHLKTISLSLSSRMPILLYGPPASGKSEMISYLASSTNNRLITLHLTDATDAKSLLGSYVCTDTPGEFKFQPGVLTKAASNGYWLLIEDINMAPDDLIGVLMSVIERREITMSSGRARTVCCADNFRVFATITTQPSSLSKSEIHLPRIPLLNPSLWTRVCVQEQTLDEIRKIVTTRFSTLPSIILDMVMQVYQGVLEIQNPAWKPITIRDLIKWLKRIEIFVARRLNENIEKYGLSEEIRFGMYMEAEDILTGHISDIAIRQVIIEKLLYSFNLNSINRKISWIPPTENDLKLVIGRAELNLQKFQRHMKNAERISMTKDFALTQHSLYNLERISCAVHPGVVEPVLLVGETGTGKTTFVQFLAASLGIKLHVVNMSNQSDTTDLLGGFKPVDIKAHLLLPLKNSFDIAFKQTFSVKENFKFLEALRMSWCQSNWNRIVVIWKKGLEMAQKKISKAMNETPKGKSVISNNPELRSLWEEIAFQVDQLEKHLHKDKLESSSSRVLFSFVEGTLVQAIKRGEWVLLDEINLASAETLECLSPLLQSATDSILLADRGDDTIIKRHPGFRIFACMNPSTDFGKRDLTPSLRNRFTEFWVNGVDETVNFRLNDSGQLLVKPIKALQIDLGQCGYKDMYQIVSRLLVNVLADHSLVHNIVHFFLYAKYLSNQRLLSNDDIATSRPHYSTRTLARSLKFSRDLCARNIFHLKRALYEGLYLTFCGSLSKASEHMIDSLIQYWIFSDSSSDNNSRLFSSDGSVPNGCEPDCFEFLYGYPIERGNEERTNSTAQMMDQYILTKTIAKNMKSLCRSLMSGFPILIQGPTSAGKTSMVEYLAAKTNHRFVRINNHEHTDIQEYIGSYIWDELRGKLVFMEGILVQALKNGWWIVLDELNLAPSDVLEALNRLLDDNRELFVPETGEIVKPSKGFQLFATQNPAGSVYGGRKFLSRAFRNRFIELEFGSIPNEELAVILEKRCKLAPSYANKMIAVFGELQTRRLSSRIFAGRDGFMTMRDLFRWAMRETETGGEQPIGENGYMLLAERTRSIQDRLVVKEVIESHFRCAIDSKRLYNQIPPNLLSTDSVFVWTTAMKRLYILLERAMRHKEAVLLVGPPGCGKTTVMQLIAKVIGKDLFILNCHQNTETADIIGSMRPNRQGQTSEQAPFLWYDGPLVQAMKKGGLFVLDEISLAEDSVLERINSVLEPSKTLVVAEKGSTSVEEIIATDDFFFCATMNPGGDFGKKELSPALRNRFTEIWVENGWENDDDLMLLICSKLNSCLFGEFHSSISQNILEFVRWSPTHLQTEVSMRDLLAWIEFMNNTGSLNPNISFIHAGVMVIIDKLGLSDSHSSFGSDQVITMKLKGAEKLCQLSGVQPDERFMQDLGIISCNLGGLHINNNGCHIQIGSFSVEKTVKNNIELDSSDLKNLSVPTTLCNLLRVVRAMQLPKNKSILLEGSPGVGKTSLITSLAKLCGCNLVRINLSEQTDLVDLFGSDLPVEGENNNDSPVFSWFDGPFLRAMKDGDWILLDELNLANQSVLEGLNACLDHRASVFIPELDRYVECASSFRVFAAQNPLNQGGGRKGLPKSFLDRFTSVYIEQLNESDLIQIGTNYAGDLVSDRIITNIVSFNNMVYRETIHNNCFAIKGKPWEFNLRDILRWLELIKCEKETHILEFVNMLYIQRIRNSTDRMKIEGMVKDVFGESIPPQNHTFDISADCIQVGNVSLPRVQSSMTLNDVPHVLSFMLPYMKTLIRCIKNKWMALIVGETGSGKTQLVRLISALVGVKLVEISMNPSVDALDMLGGYEQDTASRRFLWVDGAVVEATTKGHFLLIDNANLCNPAVLDRLNSLLEPDGSLFVSERGKSADMQLIKPHPNFRIFLTVDPELSGEVSRAMRNRGIEIYLDDCAQSSFRGNDAHKLMAQLSSPCLLYLKSRDQLTTQDIIYETRLGLESIQRECADDVHNIISPTDEPGSYPAWITGKLLLRYSKIVMSMLKALVSIRDWDLKPVMYSQRRLTLNTRSLDIFLERIIVSNMAKTDLLPYMSLKDSCKKLPHELRFKDIMRCLYVKQLHSLFYEHSRAAKSLKRSDRSIIQIGFLSSQEPNLVDRKLLWVKFYNLLNLCLSTLNEKCHGISSEDGILVDNILLELEMVVRAVIEIPATAEVVPSFVLTCIKRISSNFLKNTVLDNYSKFGGFEIEFQIAAKLWKKYCRHLTWTSEKQLHLYRQFCSLDLQGYTAEDRLMAVEGAATIFETKFQTHLSGRDLLSTLKSFLDHISSSSKSDLNRSSSTQFILKIRDLALALRSLLLDGENTNAKRVLNIAMTNSTPLSISDLVVLQHLFWNQTKHCDDSLGSLVERQLFKVACNELFHEGKPYFAAVDTIYFIDEWKCLLGNKSNLLGKAEMRSNMESYLVYLLDQMNATSLMFIESDELKLVVGSMQRLMSALDIPIGSINNSWQSFVMTVIDEMSKVNEKLRTTDFVHFFNILKSIAQSDDQPTLRILGYLWCFVGMVSLILFHTSLPFDPAQEPFCHVKIMALKRNELHQRLSFEKYMDSILSCEQDNDITAPVLSDIHDLENSIASMQQFCPIRTENGYQLAELHAAMQQITKQLAGSLCHLADRDNNQINLLVQIISTFVKEVSQKYQELDDLIHVPLLGALQIQYGLSFFIAANSLISEQSCRDLTCLSSFPSSVGASSQIVQMEEKHKVTMDSIPNMLSLLMAGFSCSCNDIRILRLFDHAAQLLIAEDRLKKEKVKAESSVYSYKDDESQMEEELARLFPSYEDTFDNNYDETDQKTSEEINTFGSLIPDLHFALMTKNPQSSCLLPSPLNSKLNTLITSIQKEYRNATMPAVFDRTSLWIRTYAIESLLEKPTESSQSSVYSSSNTEELDCLRNLLESLVFRLNELSEQWPDHPVISQCLEISHRIMSFTTTSPLMKFLLGLERLLSSLEEWESYAHSGISLKKFIDDAVRLIIKWRKLELHGWDALLKQEYEKHVCNSKQLWLHLYSMLIVKSAEELDETDDFRETFKVLNEFMLTSTIGDFQFRLNSLLAFAIHLEIICIRHSKYSRLLIQLYNYYSQFSNIVSEKHGEMKRSLEKSISDYAKIVSWRDVNVISLKHSIRASHLQLAKIVRKYRCDVLQLSVVKDVIAPFHNQQSNMMSASFSGAHNAPMSYLPEALKCQTLKISSTLIHMKVDNDVWPLTRKMKEHCRSLITRFSNSKLLSGVQGVLPMENLCDAIFTQISSFQELNMKFTSTTEANLSQIKNLRKMKQTALSELFKGLRWLGISSQRREIVDFTEIWCATGHLSNSVEVYKDSVPQLNSYFYRLISRLETMQVATQNPSQQLSVDQVGKGLGFINNLFEKITIERQLLSANVDMTSIDVIMKALHKDDMQEKMMIFDISNPDNVFYIVCDSLKRLTNSLEEFDLVKKATERHPGLRCAIEESHAKLRPLLSRAMALSTSTLFLNGRQLCIVSLTEFQAIGYDYITILEYQLLPVVEKIDSLSEFCGFLLDIISLRSSINQSGSGLADSEVKAGCYIRPIMLAIQDLSEVIQTDIVYNDSVEELLPESGLVETYMSKLHTFITKTLKAFRTDQVEVYLASLLSELVGKDSDTMTRTLQDLRVVLIEYCQLKMSVVNQICKAHRSVCKATYVLCNLFTFLFQKGYCLPENITPDMLDDNETAGELTEGTGIAEGCGKKDVSDQMEDEEQVMGLKGEEDLSNNGESNEEAGLEMQNDFDGSLEDVPASADNGSQDKDEAQDEEQQEMEDQMGDLEGKGEDIDEKFWNGNGPNEEKEGEDVDHSGGVEQEGDLQMVGKDQDDTQDQPKDEQKGQQKKTEANEPAIEENEEEEMTGENQLEMTFEPNDLETRVDHNPYEDNQENAEADDMEFPDDLQLDGGSDGEDDAQIPEQKEDEEFHTEQIDAEQESAKEKRMEEDELQDKSDTEQDHVENDQSAEREQIPSDETPPDADPSSEENGPCESAKPECNLQESKKDESEEVDDSKPDLAEKKKDNLCGDGEGIINQEESNMDATLEPTAAEHQQEQKTTLPGTSSDLEPAASSYDSEAAQSNPSIAHPEEMQKQSFGKDVVNPNRSLAEVIENWKRRLEAVRETKKKETASEPHQDDPQLKDTTTTAVVEFMEEDETSPNEIQMMADADLEQVEKQKSALQQALEKEEEPSSLVDEAEDIAMPDRIEEQDEPEPMASDPPHEQDVSKMPISGGQDKKHASKDHPVTEAESEVEKESGNMTPSRTKEQSSFHDIHDLSSSPPSALTFEPPRALEIHLDQLRAAMELQLSLYRQGQGNMDDARRLWASFQDQTLPLSMSLCEQLRLILEPTLKTKLQGDYRTGKRLNMRKMIPYIASGFKKDKIWLRRTRPSKRHYQVLLSMDDSKSMAETHAMQLAYETLALLSKALTQLEVGDLAVMRFGESVDLLHPFDRPFTNESGAQTIQQFHFDQDKTSVVELMQTSLRMLDEQRQRSHHASSGEELWQLHLIVSDGVCEDHVVLRQLVQEAKEKRILVVFIILDQREEGLFQMKQVSFENGKVQISNYMDTFPFEYYVVLRDIHGLPDVLSAALRQWFESLRS